MRFDLIDLGLFRHIVEAGSITHGAARANLALAAASKRMRNLEVSLNIQLFERARQGITLTPAGRTLLAHAKTMLEQEDRLRGDLHAYSGELAGQVRLLANNHALTAFLPSALTAFQKQHPDLHVEVNERLADEVVEQVGDGTADLGLLPASTDTGGLETYPFRSDRLVLVVPTGHVLARRKGMGFGDALDQPFVGLDARSPFQQFLSDKALAQGKSVNLKIQVRSHDAICRLVGGGVGVGVVPEAIAAPWVKVGQLKAIVLADAWALRELVICLRRLANLTPEARLLAEYLGGGSAADKPADAALEPGQQGLLI
jgi:DNA-binding transcriptional LysR family regulator